VKILLTEEQRVALVSLRIAFGDRQCVLIGGTALGCHIPMRRTTYDVDLAVVAAVDDVTAILTAAGWSRDAWRPHRWRSPAGAIADILSATEDLLRKGELRFNGDAVAMSLVGFDLAFRYRELVALPGTTTLFEVASLPVLFLLKAVAWLDRPSERSRDLCDIASILEKALPDDDERHWDFGHPVGKSDVDFEDHSAFFIGHMVGNIVLPHHRSVVDRFLATIERADSPWFAQMVREAGYIGDDPEGTLSRRLRAFRLGLVSRYTGGDLPTPS